MSATIFPSKIDFNQRQDELLKRKMAVVVAAAKKNSGGKFEFFERNFMFVFSVGRIAAAAVAAIRTGIASFFLPVDIFQNKNDNRQARTYVGT